MHISTFHIFSIVLALGGLTFALPDALNSVNTIKSSRSPNTCADPSVAQTVLQSFRADLTAHVLNYRHLYENANTRAKAIVWGDLNPTFLAWPTEQNFTVPLFQLENTNSAEIIYRVGVDAQTPPVVSGFTPFARPIAWVYASQVCGSIPLMSTGLAAFTDHYFTTSVFDHDSLVADGWNDDGVVAFVLPLYNSD